MFPHYATQIDTVALKISTGEDHTSQNIILSRILSFLRASLNAYVDPVEYKAGFDRRIEYKVYSNNRIVFSIQTGYSHQDYYIKILFAGLCTYDYIVDNTSNEYLWAVVAYLNSNKIGFSIAELDIAIDVHNVEFNSLLAFCSTHTPRTQYHDLQQKQLYHGQTNYIERFATQRSAKVAVKRAYIYNKSIKELNEHNNFIGDNLQRFEVKLQPSYFHKYGLDIAAIGDALGKYHLLYFEDIQEKYNTIERYSNYSRVTQREIQRMDLQKHRLYPDMEHIDIFLYFIQITTLEELCAL